MSIDSDNDRSAVSSQRTVIAVGGVVMCVCELVCEVVDRNGPLHMPEGLFPYQIPPHVTMRTCMRLCLKGTETEPIDGTKVGCDAPQCDLPLVNPLSLLYCISHQLYQCHLLHSIRFYWSM